MPVKSLIHNFHKIYYLLLLHLKILYIYNILYTYIYNFGIWHIFSQINQQIWLVF